MQQSTPKAILQRLIESDVLEETTEGIGLTDTFRSRYESHSTAEPERGADATGPDEAGTDAPDVAGYERALKTTGIALGEGELTVAARSLAMIDANDGEFVSVEGSALPEFLRAHERVLVLVTKADCDPCVSVRAKVEGLAEDGVVPEDVVLADVPGAESRELLWEEYEVVGAPTLLFYRHGCIEMRITGDPHLEQLRNDIERVYAQ